jgi:hypothetical protein
MLVALAAFHVPAINRYGYFRDELYYLACAARLDWGYVDHPPLSVAVLRSVTDLFGDDLWAVRMGAVLSGAGTIVLAAMIARELGGGKRAQALAMLVVLAAPVFRVVGHLYSMNGPDTLIWSVAAWVVARASRVGWSPGLWLGLGAVIGVGLMNKLSVLWLAAGVLAAVLLTSWRRELRTAWPYVAVVVAVLIVSPWLWWQIVHGWPTLEFVRNANERKLAPIPPWQFVGTQLVVMNPVAAPLWLAGVVVAWRRWRPLAIVFLVVVFILMANGRSRENYLAPAYAFVLAAGAVGAAEWWDRRPRIAAAYACALGISGALLAYLALPLAPIERLTALLGALPAPPAAERGPKSPIQGFADMFGWSEMASRVSQAVDSLPPVDRGRAYVFGSNYGQASALWFFGVDRVIGTHNAWWTWGPGRWDGSVLVGVGTLPDEALFDRLEVVDRLSHPLAAPEEATAPIWIARGLRVPVAEFWARTRRLE